MDLTPVEELSIEQIESRWAKITEVVNALDEGAHLEEDVMRYAVELLAAMRKSGAASRKADKPAASKPKPVTLDSLSALLASSPTSA